MVMDDDYYDAWDFYPDSTRRHAPRARPARSRCAASSGRIPQAGNVIFWHYDITNEGTTDYDDNIIFGLYMDSGVGGSALSCDGIYESDDDNAYFDRTFDQDVSTWSTPGTRTATARSRAATAARPATWATPTWRRPATRTDRVDNDEDGITDEKRDGGAGHADRRPGRDPRLRRSRTTT